MKLHNKKTGHVIDLNEWTIQSGYLYIILSNDSDSTTCYKYESLAELNKEWEDYILKEPLIKDKNTRKAVRAWAGANGLSDKLRVINERLDYCKVLGLCDSRNICLQTEFKTTIAHVNKNQYYTIDELCGEEEE